MTIGERLVADFGGTGLTTGPHPMQYQRQGLRASGVLAERELSRMRDGVYVRTAGCVIARQRPGTASMYETASRISAGIAATLSCMP